MTEDSAMHGSGNGGNASASPQEPPLDDRQLVKWIEVQSPQDQERITTNEFRQLLEKAAQPRHASGTACIKLCYFIEQCRSSKISIIQSFAFSKETCLELFSFYIEWNDKSQHRSMRQVLELVSSLIARNPDKETASALKTAIGHRNLAIITHQAAQPLVKPAFKCLEYLIGKGTISIQILIRAYESAMRDKKSVAVSEGSQSEEIWNHFFNEIFDWMVLPDISPAAGKFLVSTFRALKDHSAKHNELETRYSASWQRWISRGLDRNPEALENVKNYLFPRLFKLDRAGSIVFLQDLNAKVSTWDAAENIHAHTLLRLSAMEIGKKSGLVEEPATIECLNTSKKTPVAVVLREDTLNPLIQHAFDTVRSLAFSVLVSSLSSIRPFSHVALQILKSTMGVLYSDPDAKFRNEVLSNTKHMIERLRGATSLMMREVENLSYQPLQVEKLHGSNKQQETLREVTALLEAHQDFVAWYLEFLLGELIPTASYQRHITALKAIMLLVSSGIHNGVPAKVRTLGNATAWPFSINFFTPGVVRLLMDLLLDPFEDVRSSAADILRLASPTSFQTISAVEDLTPRIVLKKKESSLDFLAKPTISSRSEQARDRGRPLGILLDFVSSAEAISMQTGRADYADGLARSFQLLYGLQPSADARVNLLLQLINNLEEKLQAAENNLGHAVLGAPIHGYFAALRFIWDSVTFPKHRSTEKQYELGTRAQLDSLQQRMTNACVRIWKAVKEVLCNDSPEGHLLEDLDEVEAVDTKNILSYSFRAIHESSNLLRSLVAKIKISVPEDSPVLPLRLFEIIGDLTFEQLSSLRHRGAFSTVSLTFATCCQLTQEKGLGPAPAATMGARLKNWYLDALNCIDEQSSTTRRSAGVPALITGIMSAQSEDALFDDIMKELISISRRPLPVPDLGPQMAEEVPISEAEPRIPNPRPTKLPQVHALNSLREAFKSSAFGTLCQPYIGDCLQLALECLESDIWAIRNCGLLLFRSIIDILFSTSVSKSEIENGWDGRSIKIQYDMYPTLPSFLEKFLDCSGGPDDSLQPEAVLPALDIIRRAGPPAGASTLFFKLVVQQLDSPIWNVREMAGRALCALTMQDDLEVRLIELLTNTTEKTNFRHGSLLAARLMIDRRAALNPLGVTGIEMFDEIITTLDEELSVECSYLFRSSIVVELIEVKNAMISAAVAASKVPAALENLSDEDFSAHISRAFKLEKCPPVCRAFIRQVLLLAALRSDSKKLLEIVRQAITVLDSDAALEILNVISENFNSNIDVTISIQVYEIIYNNYTSPDVRASALSGLSQALEGHYDHHPRQEDLVRAVLDLRSFPGPSTNSPTFSNAWVAFSGWIILFKTRQLEKKEVGANVKLCKEFVSWADLLRAFGEAQNDFDDRLAAAKSLQCFFSRAEIREAHHEVLLPILMVLYDTLNDDDSEIREIGAKLVSRLAKESFVPLAAARWLAEKFLLPSHGSSMSFAWIVVCKMTGTQPVFDGNKIFLHPANIQLSSARSQSQELFNIENPNLYIDEARETNLWSEILIDLPRQASPWHSEPINALLDWSIEGLRLLFGSAAQESKFHWDSDPATFAVCARILSCTMAVHLYYFDNTKNRGDENPQPGLEYWDGKTKEISVAMRGFLDLSITGRFHPSLFARLLDREPLRTWL